MSSDGKRAESAQKPAVLEREQAERDYDEKYCFFMHVPAEEEGGVRAEGCRTDKSFPGWCK